MLQQLQRIRRDFRDIDHTQALLRAFDSRPVQCSLYVTERCNLNCAYCTEHDSAAAHPSIGHLKSWVAKVRELGTLKIALVGGEPLMHPHIVELVRFCKGLGMSTSLTTNGFLLTEELVQGLQHAGLDVMQVSVDRVTPCASTQKSLKTVGAKLELLQNSPIKLHITGVICRDTLDECEQVLDYGLKRGIPTEIRLVHPGPDGVMKVDPGTRQRVLHILQRMLARKRAGEGVHTTRALLDYQIGAMAGRNVHDTWTCAAGYKLFFVSASGEFMECSMRPTGKAIADITSADLRQYYRQKKCQENCGVYCAIGVSLFLGNPVKYVRGELMPRLLQTLSQLQTRGSTGLHGA